MKNLIILLFMSISFLLHAPYILGMEEALGMYKIITLDNVEDKIPQKYLLLSKAISDMVHDVPNNDSPISLPINFEILPILKKCLENSYIAQDNRASDILRTTAQQELVTLLSSQANLYPILMFADKFEVLYLLEECMQIWAKAKYKPDGQYNLPSQINKQIACYMERSKRLINSVAGWIAKDLEKNKTKVLEKTLKPTLNPLWATAISNDGFLIAAGDSFGRITIYNTKSDTYTFIKSKQPNCTRLQFNENDSQVWSAGHNGTIKIWDLATHKNITTFQSPTHCSFTFCYIPQHKIVITDGKQTTGTTYKLCYWNLLENKTNPEIIDAHIGYINALESAHDGSLFASASQDGSVRIWDTTTKKTNTFLDDNNKNIISISFNHANNTLISGSENGSITLYDIPTKKQLFYFKQENSKSIWTVLFDKADTLFCSGSDDTKIKLWDTHTKLPIAILSSHSGAIQSMALNSQNNTLVSASCDGTAKLWDLRKLVNPIITLRNEFLQSSIEQILMLENADVSEAPMPMNNPHRYDLFQSFSPNARRILLENENIIQ